MVTALNTGLPDASTMIFERSFVLRKLCVMLLSTSPLSHTISMETSHISWFPLFVYVTVYTIPVPATIPGNTPCGSHSILIARSIPGNEMLPDT